MTPEELDIKRFELEQTVKLEELGLRKKEVDLRIQEQKRRRFGTPLTLSVVGGLLTLITGIVLNYVEREHALDLEEKKFQSSLLLKATDAESYEEFSDMLVGLQQNGLLTLDSGQVASFRKDRFMDQDPMAYTKSSEDLPMALVEADLSAKPSSSDFPAEQWTIVSWSGPSLDKARARKAQAERLGFQDILICFRNGTYGTCLGQYPAPAKGLDKLFDAREAINGDAYLIQLGEWCPGASFDASTGVYSCGS